MSQFGIVTLTLSFILGLSMTHILWSAASAVRARKMLTLHWGPLIWAACIFFLHVQYWFNALTIDLIIEEWSWAWYLTVLLLAVLLFASGALILPTDLHQRSGQLLDDFREHGRLSLLPLAAYCVLQIVTSVPLGSSPFVIGNLVQMVLTVLALLAFFSKRSMVQSVTALLFLVLEIWATVFLWSRDAMLEF